MRAVGSMELHAPNHWQTLDFVSDLHLQDSYPRTLRGFIDYLDSSPADAIFILGDLFEFWVGDDWIDEPQDAHRQCLDALARAGRRLALHIMRIVLGHGDALCTGDTRYQEFRQLSRAEEWQRNFLAEPLAGRTSRMLGMRQQSEANKKASTMFFDVDDHAALALLQQCRASTLVHGHTHKPDHHTLDAAHTRWVLTDWDLDGDTPRSGVLRLRAVTPGPLRWERVAAQ